NGSTPPRSISSLWSVLAARLKSQRTLSSMTGEPRSATSQPLFSTSPMLRNGNSAKPDDGGTGTVRIRSVVRLWKYVTSRPSRWFRKPASNPASYSVPFSGFSSKLPGREGVTPLPVSPGMIEYGFAAYVSSDAPALGARPVVPYATRRRMDGMMCAIGSQNDSSEITYEM